jgi:glycosyltransferase involved in cell wall biosynthesis
MSENQKVSVIMPMYNSSNTIQRAASSVLQQDYQDLELLIIDDGSSDNSVTLANELCKKDKRVKVFQLEKNQGAAVARNKGIQNATGRYIAFLDSDDLWYSNKLSKQIDYINAHQIGFVCSAYHVVDANDKQVATFVPPDKASYRDLLRTCSVGCLTALYDTNVFGKTLMPVIKRRQDYALWLDLLRSGEFCYGIKEPLAAYKVGTASLSNNKFKAARYQWTVYREVEKLPLLNSCYYFVTYCVNGLLKYRN